MVVVSLNMKRRYEINKRCLQSADEKKHVYLVICIKIILCIYMMDNHMKNKR